jgi:hypothetical protein
VLPNIRHSRLIDHGTGKDRKGQAAAQIPQTEHVPAPVDWYPLLPNPVVAESLLDRLINTSHQVFMNGPSYRPNKRPRRVVPNGNTSGN